MLRDLLALGRPRIAVVARASYERTNPGPEALSELLRERRMREVGTDEFGTVRLRICPGGRAVISGYRGGEWKRIDAFQAGPPRYAAPPPPPPLP